MILRLLVSAALWYSLSYSASTYAVAHYSEEEIKAAFLFRFTSYVEWPDDALGEGPFTIAVLDASGIADKLELILPKYLIKGRPARVHRIESIDDVGDAQVLFLSRPYSTKSVIAALVKRPVLIVTDSDRGLYAGGTVNFILVDSRVRFEVSLAAAEEAGLRISSELLAVATRVQRGKDGSDAFCLHRGLFDDSDARCSTLIAWPLRDRAPSVQSGTHSWFLSNIHSAYAATF